MAHPPLFLACHVSPVSPGVHNDGKDITPVVHVHPEVEAGHIAETAVLPQLVEAGVNARACVPQGGGNERTGDTINYDTFAPVTTKKDMTTSKINGIIDDGALMKRVMLARYGARRS